MLIKKNGFGGGLPSTITHCSILFLVSYFQLCAQMHDSLGKDSAAISLRFSALTYVAHWDSVLADTAFDRTVITHAELLKHYHEDLADILDRYGGIYSQDLGSFGRPVTITLGASQHAQILLDGVPMRDPDVNWTNLNLISLDNIEKIEVFRGAIPRINIITRRIKDEPVTTFKYRSIGDNFRDVGIYFGRPIGSRWRFYAGGASRGTPNEQFYNKIVDGVLTTSIRSRYSATQYFGGLDYLINDVWMTKFYYQKNTDRYDSYGRNLASQGVDLTTSGGLRNEERTVYRTHLNYLNGGTRFELIGESSRTLHGVKKFLRNPVPNEYTARRYSSDFIFSRRFSDHWASVHLRLEADRVDSLQLPDRRFKKTQLRISDQFQLQGIILEPTLEYEYHSIYHSVKSLSLDVQKSFSSITYTSGFGYREEFPSLMEEFQNTIQTFPNVFAGGIRRNYSFPRDSVLHLPVTKMLLLNSGLKIAENQIFNSIELRFSYKRFAGGKFLSQVIRDSVRYEALKNMEVYSAEVAATKKWKWTEWTLRQTFMKGDASALQGIPYYRVYLTGYGELFFFEKNLKLAGDMTGAYYSRHSGWSYKDAPSFYYATPNHQKGGFLFSTRVSAYIGDIQIFYEAENILRAHFAKLDGYAVTPQQYRFGFVWNLFN